MRGHNNPNQQLIISSKKRKIDQSKRGGLRIHLQMLLSTNISTGRVSLGPLARHSQRTIFALVWWKERAHRMIPKICTELLQMQMHPCIVGAKLYMRKLVVLAFNTLTVSEIQFLPIWQIGLFLALAACTKRSWICCFSATGIFEINS